MLAPLTPAVAVGAWTVDVGSALVVSILGVAYLWCHRRRPEGGPAAAVMFAVGLLSWVLATMSVIGVYAGTLFWVRATQVLMLLFVAPFFLAMGRPLTVLRAAVPPAWQHRIDSALGTPLARTVAHPFTTSVAMLATPWLLYLTPWYRSTLESPATAAGTRMVLVAIGFAYFYARLQADPVPRRYPQAVSMVISIAETLGDGVLGLVLWQGPLICADLYMRAHAGWGPSLRNDQSIGAGILWIMGDVLSVPFLIILMRALSADESKRAALVDAELDRLAERGDRPSVDPQAADDGLAQSSLWWENDPQLRERFGRG